MGGHADRRERGEDMLADAVVENALSADRAARLGVEGGRVILELLDERSGFRTFVKDLGLAFVNLAAANHGGF
jgi:hypothetical protein